MFEAGNAVCRGDKSRCIWYNCNAENVYANLYILGGMTCYVLSFVVWLVVLSRVEVSVAYPMLSAGYIVTAFAGWYFWGEALTMNKFLGIGLICFGVLFMFKN